jgi:hypothetical protein
MGLCQALGEGACGTDLFIGGKDMAGEKPIPFLILPSFLLFNLFNLYSRVEKWAGTTGSDLTGFGVVGLSFGPHLLTTGGANTGAS